MRLKDKTAVITGGTRGIGKAIVQSFAKEGARVLFTYATNEQLAKQLSEEIAGAGGTAEGYRVDIRDYERVEKWKNDLLEKYGSIDILVNNAGIIKDKALMMMSRDDWHDVIDTNLNGLYNTTKNFIIAFMKQKQGSIINIASLSGLIGLPRQTNYGASKGGMISFTKALAKEVAAFGIRVNAIAPGFIETDMTRGLNREFLAKATAQIPLGRIGIPEEVSRVAVFLAGEESSYITGQTISVCGGMGI